MVMIVKKEGGKEATDEKKEASCAAAMRAFGEEAEK